MSGCADGDGASEDPVLAASAAVERAIAVATEALGAVRASLEATAAQRKAGMALPELVERYRQAGGVETRRAAGAALDEYERVFMALRAEIVRELVDQHGHSLSEVARTMNISRQLVARLLAAGRSGTSGAR